MTRLFLSLLFFTLSLAGCGKKETPTPPKAPEPAAAAVSEETKREIDRHVTTLERGRIDGRLERYTIEQLVAIGPPAVDGLIKGLADPKPDTRIACAKALLEINDPRSTDAFLGLLEKEKDTLRTLAIRALGRLKETRAVIPLLGLLDHPTPWMRILVAEALGKIGDAKAAEPLTRTLRDKSRDVRPRAAEALLRIGRPAVGPLIKALRKEGARGRDLAADALGKIGDARAVDPLMKTLSDENPIIRAAAAKALGQLKDPRAIPNLLRALKDDARNVRMEAAVALGAVGDRSAVEPLRTLCDPAEMPDVRLFASTAACILQPNEEAFAYVLEVATSRDSRIYGYGISCLGAIGDPRAVDPLMDLLRDRYQKVQPHVKSALVKIGPPAVPPLVRFLKDRHMRIRNIAAIALGQIADKEAVPGLIGALEDPNEIVSGWAAYGLGRIGDERAVAPLIGRLSNERTRTQVAAALASIGKPAIEPLSRALESEDPRVRRGAVQALGGIKASAAVRALIPALADTDYQTQSQAIRELEKRERSAVPHLILALKSENRKIRDVAALVLASIGDKRAVGPLIEAWKKDPGFAERVSGILRRLTGKTFGPKVEEWENWHRENR